MGIKRGIIKGLMIALCFISLSVVNADAATIKVFTIDSKDEVMLTDKEFSASAGSIKDITGLWVYTEKGETLDLSMLRGISNVEYLTYINFYPLWHLTQGEISYEEIDSREENYSITNLEALTHIKNLENLGIVAANNITDLRPISTLKNLESLYLERCSIKSLEGIQNLRTLTSLNLEYLDIEDLSLLSTTENLRYLVLNNLKANNIDSIKSLNNLIFLEIFEVNIDNEDIKNIESLSNLEHLSLSTLRVDTLDSLKNLNNLKELTLDNLNIRNIDILSNLESLRSLNLYILPIENLNIVQKLQKLEKLRISETRVYDISVIDELKSLKELVIYSSYIDVDTISQKYIDMLGMQNQFLSYKVQKRLSSDIKEIKLEKGQEIAFEDLKLKIINLENGENNWVELPFQVDRDINAYTYDYDDAFYRNEAQEVIDTLTLKSSNEDVLRVDNEKKVLIAENAGEITLYATLFNLEQDLATLTTKIDFKVEVADKKVMGSISPDINPLIPLIAGIAGIFLFFITKRRYMIYLTSKKTGFVARKVETKRKAKVYIELKEEEIGMIDIKMTEKDTKKMDGSVIILTYEGRVVYEVQIRKEDIKEGMYFISL